MGKIFPPKRKVRGPECRCHGLFGYEVGVYAYRNAYFKMKSIARMMEPMLSSLYFPLQM